MIDKKHSKSPIIILVLVVSLIIWYLAYTYIRSHENVEDSDKNTKVSKNDAHVERDINTKSANNPPCFESSIEALALIELIKQESKMCGQQKRFNQYFDSPLTVGVYEVSKKCLVDEGINNGFTVSDADKYSDAYIADKVSKLNDAEMNKNKKLTCSSLNAVFTKLGF